MTQALYAHMNNKKINKDCPLDFVCRPPGHLQIGTVLLFPSDLYAFSYLIAVGRTSYVE
jgi:hypothetical protein